MRLLRIALLTLATALAASLAVKADNFNFNMTSPTLDAQLTITATRGPTYDVVTGIKGTFWESAMGGTSLTNSITGVFTVVPAATGNDPITGNSIGPASGSACAAGGQGPSPACFINGVFYYDNLIYPANTPGPGSLDWGGLLFGIPSTQFELNIFSSDASSWYWADNQGGHSNNPVIAGQTGNGLTAVTPEPASLLLLGTGLLGLAIGVFARSRQHHPMFYSM